MARFVGDYGVQSRALIYRASEARVKDAGAYV
jgi:hypothetical protein